MAMKVVSQFRSVTILCVCLVALMFAAACGSTTPTAPSPAPDPCEEPPEANPVVWSAPTCPEPHRRQKADKE